MESIEHQENISPSEDNKDLLSTEEESDNLRLKEALERMETMPDETKDEYGEFMEKVIETNPELLSNTETAGMETLIKIFDIEKKYDYRFFGKRYNDVGGKFLSLERRKLLALKDLNLLSKDEKKQLDLIEGDFEKVAAEINEITGRSKELCKDYLDKLLDSGFAADTIEAKNILINGPKISGFEETEDVKIPNKKVSEFLENAFSKSILRECFVAVIEKDDKWLIKGPTIKGHKDTDNINKLNELLRRFKVNLHGVDTLIAPNKEEYLKIAMHLENVDEPNKLKHIYKLRGTAGEEDGFAKIDFHNFFGVEDPKIFDYLNEHPLLSSMEQKKQAYILGGIGHEVTHRIKFHFPEKIVKFNEYKKIAKEGFLKDKKFVSEYVRLHRDLYKSDENEIIGEDLAEAVRIYLIDSDYLKTEFLSRYEFIKENYPFLKENAAVDVITT